MNKIFEDGVLKKKFLILICFIVIINAFLLTFWYFVLIKPTVSQLSRTKEELTNYGLVDEYDSLKELKDSINKIEKEYEVKFNVINEDKKTIINANKQDNDFYLLNDLVYINDDIYFVTIYLHRDLSMTSIVISMIVFQIIVILILMISVFLATGKTIINPIQKIINDIRAYKFGIKPNKNELNTELDIIQNEFVNLVDTLESEKKEQNRIIASISHDIKTPLTSIMGYSTLLDDNNLSKEEIQKYSVKIHEKATHIKNILSTFDDYLINYDNKKLKLDNICVKDIASDLITDYKVELECKKIDFDVNMNCNNEIVNVDILKLKRVFSNIISNSLRFVPKDNGKITVDINSDNQFVYFSVSDNGPGIEVSIIDKVFDPFFTTDKSRKISGLGLSICKEFIELLGGKVSLKNKNGLIVTFSIPISFNETGKRIKRKI